MSKTLTFSKRKPQVFFIDNYTTNKSLGHRNNMVIQTKYNLFTFLPKSLLIQFLKMANCYFLLMAIIQSIPVISPLNPGSAIAPLVFVVLVSMIKEGVEDYNRRVYDNRTNSELVSVYREGKWKQEKAGLLHIGEFVCVSKNSIFPADLLLLDSSFDEGICYVETGSLDGEKHLKLKAALMKTKGEFSENGTPKKTISMPGKITCDHPNPNLYDFEGIYMNETGSSLVFSPKQLLLKGASLKNTDWIVGVVAYTGHNTKIILNSKKPRNKISKLENLLGRLIILILIFQLGFCSISAIGFSLRHDDMGAGHSYIPAIVEVEAVDRILIFLSYLLLYNTMIPISLIVTSEIVKIIQGKFMSWDADLYSLVRGKRLKATGTALNEELGNIDYIFSDKTGTITANKMDFKFAHIGKNVYYYSKYEEPLPEVVLRKLISNKIEPIDLDKNLLREEVSDPSQQMLFKYQGIQIELMKEFWLTISLANECSLHKDEETNTEEYIGMSPDDIELVKTSAALGFELSGKSNLKARVLNIFGISKEFEILNVFEFTSDRKRMSIIIRENGQIRLYMKGADNEMFNRLSSDNDPNFVESAKSSIEFFSSQGFRTLVLGMKHIREADYTTWLEELNKGNENFEMKKEIDAQCAEDIEKDLCLIGVTVVEDKLQDNVPITIRDLRMADIKIWMLTGDKLTTAYNIGLSCNLICAENVNFTLRGNDDNMLNTLENAYGEFLKQGQEQEFSILIDSEALHCIMRSGRKTQTFLNIALKAVSVVCCRVSPLQKAEIVRAVKEHDKTCVTLSVGDGGNDVSMIMEAHVGVGIYGEEGIRAVQAGDFAVGEFQFLRRLLINHGRLNMIRISEMILYFFYKNFTFTLVHFLFGFYNNFSGQTIIDDFSITTFNLIFTAFPLSVKAVIEKDFDEHDGDVIFKLLPFLYSETKNNPIFNIHNLMKTLVVAIIESCLNFFLTITFLHNAPMGSEGSMPSMWVISTVLFNNIVVVYH